MAQVIAAISKNYPPPIDPTLMEPAQNVGDNPNAPYTTTKIQPCNLELVFESIDPIVVNIIDWGGLPWKSCGNFFTKTLLKPIACNLLL